MAKLFEQLKEELKYELLGLLFVASAVFGFISLYAAQSEIADIPSAGAGAVGQFIVSVLSLIAGKGKIAVPLLLAYVGIQIMTKGSRFSVNRTMVGFCLGMLLMLTLMHMRLPENLSLWQSGIAGEGGGVVGAVLAIVLKTLFGTIGTYVVLSSLLLASLLFAFEISLVELVRNTGRKVGSGYGQTKKQLDNFLYSVVDDEETASYRQKAKRSRRGTSQPREEQPTKSEDFSSDDHIDVPLVIIDHQDQTPQWLKETELPRDFEPKAGFQKDPLPETAKAEAFQPYTSEEVDELEDTLVGEKLANGMKTPATTAPTYLINGDEDYVLPPLTILTKTLTVKSTRLHQEITDNVKILEETLESFGVKVKVTQVNKGPAITRYEVQPAPGVKVSKITNLADDIALSLAAPAVRIEAPIPGKAAVGIEVPNREVSPVTFREVLEAPEYQQSGSKLTIGLGKDIAGASVVSELSRMPHLLIAGATGSGKSVCMNTLICSILFKSKPSEVKFLMVDPKMVELTQYNGIPHLIAPVVTDAKKAATALKWIVTEMENRYETFAVNGVKDIGRYNSLKAQENPDQPTPAMPYIVVLIDELADLMMVSPVDVEDAICRLAQMARAAGIHLVVATQRPSVDVITGIIKANIPSRIAFAVSSQTDSRTILDMAGAEKLLGRGDMLFFPVGAQKPLRVQGCYVSDKEVEELVEYLKNQALPEYLEGIIKAQETVVEEHAEEEDELFVDAVNLLMDSGQASISMIQRRLRVGYARAARLIDLMEQRGIVGGFEGSKPREILMSRGQFEARYGKKIETGS